MKFKRAFVTHRKRIDPKLEEATYLLYQQLNKNKYYNEHQKIYSSKNDWIINPIHENKKQVKSSLKQLKYSFDKSEE